MDHLPLPERLRVRHFSARFIDHDVVRWDGKDWDTFEERCHGRLRAVHDTLQSPQNQREVATSFMQNWLFFGTLSVFLMQAIQLQNWLRSAENGEWFLSTERLPQALRDWKNEVLRCGSDETNQIRSRIANLLHLAPRRQQRLKCGPSFAALASGTVEGETMLAVSVLYDTLTLAWNEAFNKKMVLLRAASSMESDLLWEELRRNGYSPFSRF